MFSKMNISKKAKIIIIAVILAITVGGGIFAAMYIRNSKSVPSVTSASQNKVLPTNAATTDTPSASGIPSSQASITAEATSTPTNTPTPTEQATQTPTPVPSEPTTQAPTAAPSNWWDYPAEILPVTKDPNDLLVLVTKKYQLPSTYYPGDLVSLSATGIRTTYAMQVRQVILADLSRLGADASVAGIDLSVISAFRSYATQQSTYNYWVSYEGGNASAADKYSARPGHSQHQLGTVVDFSTSEIGDQIGSVFDSTRAASWLNENAWKYGFALSYPAGGESITGYQYESWHYRYIGVDNAAAWKASGQILDVWLIGR